MGTTVRSTGAKILVVEDNRLNSVVIRRLVELAGFTADAAYSGRDALEHLAEHAYDLVLMDLQLPDMTGIEIARSMREGGSLVRNQSVPIVALTGYADAADREACRKVGIETVIEKPIDRSTLAELVRRHVSAKRTDTASAQQPAIRTTGHPIQESARPLPFDAPELETRLGSEQLARTVATRFLSILNERHAAVKAALAAGEPAEIRHAAHSLAGPAANSGAAALHTLLKRVESAAAANTAPGQAALAAATGLDEEVERTRRALERYLRKF
ncbi:MAG: response regulator [Spirochaetaceae bacterium]